LTGENPGVSRVYRKSTGCRKNKWTGHPSAAKVSLVGGMAADRKQDAKMANENLALPEHRDMALALYRLNLHGTAWKIEIGDFASALEMLADGVRSCTKAREFDRAQAWKVLRLKVSVYARRHRQAAKRAA